MQQNNIIPGVFRTQSAPARLPVFYEVDVSDRGFNLDYKLRNYVYAYTPDGVTLFAKGYGTTDLSQNAWTPIPFPETTPLNIPGQVASNHLIIQCLDVPLITNLMQLPRVIADMLFLSKETVSSFSTGDLFGQAYSELAIDFTVYAINGGTAPTVTFQVLRKGLDGQYYVLESATPLSAPGVISYSIGAGLDGKSFGGTFRVNMVTTGAPTSVQISGSIKAKQ